MSALLSSSLVIRLKIGSIGDAGAFGGSTVVLVGTIVSVVDAAAGTVVGGAVILAASVVVGINLIGASVVVLTVVSWPRVMFTKYRPTAFRAPVGNLRRIYLVQVL